MGLRFESLEQSNPHYICPVCGHQLVPPEYPYCEHLAFMYVDCETGDAGFDHTDHDFASRHLEVLKNAVADPGDEEIELPSEDEYARFLSGDRSPFGSQDILLDPNLIDESVFPGNTLIVTIEETEGYYPTTIMFAVRTSGR